MKKIIFISIMILSFLFVSCEKDKNSIEKAADKIEKSLIKQARRQKRQVKKPEMI